MVDTLISLENNAVVTPRPFIDRLELRHPTLARMSVSLLLALPARLRAPAVKSAFDRATRKFNRHDLDAMLSGWADEVEYQPPPPVAGGARTTTRLAAADFWRRTFERYPETWMEDLDVRQVAPHMLQRTARVHHAEPESGRRLDYVIVQTVEIRNGLVVRMIDQLIDEPTPA